jgi:hypothetical protein
VPAKGALYGRIKQNQVPSSLIIREIQRASRNQASAIAGNFNDNYIAAFSPYIQRLEVDKRTLDFAERAGRRSDFLSAVRAKMFRKSDLSALAQELDHANP